MPELIFLLLSGTAFVASSGIYFRKRHSDNKVLAGAAGAVAVLSTLFLLPSLWNATWPPVRAAFSAVGHALKTMSKSKPGPARQADPAPEAPAVAAETAAPPNPGEVGTPQWEADYEAKRFKYYKADGFGDDQAKFEAQKEREAIEAIALGPVADRQVASLAAGKVKFFIGEKGDALIVRVVSAARISPGIGVDVDQDGIDDSQNDYYFAMTGLWPSYSAYANYKDCIDTYALKKYHYRRFLYSSFATKSKFGFHQLDADNGEFVYVIPKNELSLTGLSASLSLSGWREMAGTAGTVKISYPFLNPVEPTSLSAFNSTHHTHDTSMTGQKEK